MAEYIVRWEIQLDAETPKKAAERALEIQRDPASIATFFEVVKHSTREIKYIDLGEESHA